MNGYHSSVAREESRPVWDAGIPASDTKAQYGKMFADLLANVY